MEIGNIGNLSPQIPSSADQKIIRLNEMRINKQPVDIMQMFEAFSPGARKPLLKGMQHTQFTDGCTGGCPWCGFDVKRKISTGFDFDSYLEFAKKYGRDLPNAVALYWASDPLDIRGIKKDGTPYDYADVVAAIIPYLRKDQRIYTSTTIPKGTEATAIKLLTYLHDLWKENYRFNHDGRLHTVRFSLTAENKEVIKSIKDKLSASGLDPQYIEAQFNTIEERNDDSIRKLGKFIKHPKRQVLSQDSATIACYDGVLTTPDGIYAVFMDMATKDSPYGYGLHKLDPQSAILEIPKYRRTEDYWTAPVAKKIIAGSGDVLLPPVQYDRIESKTGNIIETVTVPSLRRDALTFFYILAALRNAGTNMRTPQAKANLIRLQSDINSRYLSAQSRFAKETDAEAKLALEPLYIDINNEIQRLKSQ